MKLFRLITLAFVLVLGVAALPGVAHAARPNNPTVYTGIDISWPQCGKPFPKGQAFGIVGVNGGKVTNTNPCLAEQLRWAAGSGGQVTAQDKVQLYVNTANPGEVLEQYAVTSWPTTNIDSRNHVTLGNENPLLNNPYGECTTTEGVYRGYTNDMACSWQYGWNRAVETVDERFNPAVSKAIAAGVTSLASDPKAYIWWLDVETTNSWQGENDAENVSGLAAKRARNTATLEAMKAFYHSEGITRVGLYSTSLQWGRIVGSTINDPASTTGDNLNGLDGWLAGAANLSDAQKRCTSNGPLTNLGRVSLVQYIAKNLDYNYSCI